VAEDTLLSLLDLVDDGADADRGGWIEDLLDARNEREIHTGCFSIEMISES